MLAIGFFMLNFWNICSKEEIEEKGLSVRCNTLGIVQAVDMAGEQSYMKSAKTVGGIRQFSTIEAAAVIRQVGNESSFSSQIC